MSYPMNSLAPFPFTSAPRIALFSGNYNYVRDGANQALNRLVDFLGRQQIAVRVYSPTAKTPAFAHAGQLVSVPSVAIPRRKEYRLALGLPDNIKRDIAQFRPNIVHLSAPDALGYSALQFSRRLGIPAVASVHTRFETYLGYYGLQWLEPYALKYLRHFYGQCAQIYAPAEGMAQVLRAQGMSHDIRLWGRGVDGLLFNPGRREPAWRQSLGFADTDIVVAFVGRLVLEKGLGLFADAVDAAAARNSRVKVLVVGDGPEAGWFKARLPAAKFIGFLSGEALARAYASADIFFNPSTTETFGNVTLEAMACGIPAICANATGSASLVVHGETGFLAAENTAREFSDYISGLATNADLRRAMGAAARNRSETYDWDHILSGVLANYREVLADPWHAKARAPVLALAS